MGGEGKPTQEPGSPRLCSPQRGWPPHSGRPSSGPAKHLPAPPAVDRSGLQRKNSAFSLWTNLRVQRVHGIGAAQIHSSWPLESPSAFHWQAGREVSEHCLPTFPASHQPAFHFHLHRDEPDSHPISPVGEAGKGVIRSCPPLHRFPLTLPNLIPYPGLLSFPPQMVNSHLQGHQPPPHTNPCSNAKSPLPNGGSNPQIGIRKHTALSQPDT